SLMLWRVMVAPVLVLMPRRVTSPLLRLPGEVIAYLAYSPHVQHLLGGSPGHREVSAAYHPIDRRHQGRLVAGTGDEGAADVLRSRGGFAQLLVKPVSAADLHDALAQPG